MQEEDFQSALQSKLTRLKAEIKVAQQEIEDKQLLVKNKQEQIEHVIRLLDAEGVHIDRTELDGTVPVSLAEILAKVMRDQSPQPLHYKTLTELVRQASYKIAGQNPQATVIALLHRKQDQFARLGQGMWGLVEWNLPANVSHAQKRRKSRRSPKRTGR